MRKNTVPMRPKPHSTVFLMLVAASGIQGYKEVFQELGGTYQFKG